MGWFGGTIIFGNIHIFHKLTMISWSSSLQRHKKTHGDSLPWIKNIRWHRCERWCWNGACWNLCFFDQQFLVIGRGKGLDPIWINLEMLKCMYDNHNRWSRFGISKHTMRAQTWHPQEKWPTWYWNHAKHSNEKTSEHPADYRKSSKRIEGGCTMKGSTIIPCQREGLILASMFSLCES